MKMREVTVSINNVKYKAKKLDDSFADFIERNLRESGVSLESDNSAERLFVAYLRLAGKFRSHEKEIEEIIENIEFPS
jgi:hypothetical protein